MRGGLFVFGGGSGTLRPPQMFPVIFKIGTFEVRSYGVMLIIGFLVGIWMVRRRAARFGLEDRDIADSSLMTLFSGIIGARLMFILLELPYYWRNPGELLSWRFQGLTSFGGLIGGLLYLWWFCKRRGRSLVAMLDAFSAPMLIASAIGRIGCLLNGCCYGALCQTGVTYCVPAEGQVGLYQPAQLVDAVLNVVGYFALIAFEKRGLARGQSIGLFLVFYGLSRFIYEFWRAGTTSEMLGPVTMAQLLALAMVLAGGLLFRFFGRRALPKDGKVAE